MQNLQRIDLFQRAIRSQICTQCYQRPLGSEAEPPTHPRACEPTCAIFLNLSRIVTAAVRDQQDASGASADWLLREVVCHHCTAAPSAGDFCAENLARTCPLSRYGQDVIDLIQRTCET